MKLRLGFDLPRFATELAHEVTAGGTTVVDAVEELLAGHLSNAISEALGSDLVKPPRAVVHSTYFKRRFETLHGLAKAGYETWYSEVLFATEHARAVEVRELDLFGIETAAITYGGGVERMFHFSRKQLRRQTNHLLRLNVVRIPCGVFDDALCQIDPGQLRDQSLIANLTLGPPIVGFRLASFDHVLTGDRVFCACQQETHGAMLSEAQSMAPRFVRGSWPHRFIHALNGARYVAGVCHLCIAAESGCIEAASIYGDSVQAHPEPYIDILVRRDGLDPVTAKADVNARLGLARWVREAELHKLVKKLFPEVTVRREASPQWLGRQRLDIYIPELRLAIEHQGQQHYQAVSAFGGDDALQRTKERDLRKHSLCSENGVSVVEVRFNEPLTLPYLRQRLRRWTQRRP